MKRTAPLPHLLLVLAWAVSAAHAADESAKPEVPAAAAAGKVRVQIQQRAVPLDKAGAPPAIPDVQELRFQLNDVKAQIADATERLSAAKMQRQAPPVILLPGIPYIPLPNPLAKWDTRPGYLGVVLDTDTDQEAAEEGAKNDAPKKITSVGIGSVVNDSPAEKAGLKEGDRVLTLEGKEAKTSAQLREMIRALKPEQEVKLSVRRDGKEMELKAKLAAAPEQIAGGQMLRLNGNIVIGGINAGGDEPQAVPGVVTFRNTTSSTRSTSSTALGAQADKDSVTLRDGNRFLGKIRGMDPAKGLTLERDGQAALELIEEEISALTFAEPKKTDDAPKVATTVKTTALPKVVLQLRDGSIVYGETLTMEKGMLRITLPVGQSAPGGQSATGGQSAAGGQAIEIPREHAQSATLSDGESPQIYEGPTAMTGWTSGRYTSAQWEYKDGQLRCTGNGPIGRNLGRLPDSTDMSFDVNFPRQMQHVGVMLFSTGVNESATGNLSLNFSPDQISGSHYDGKRSNQYSAVQEQKGPRDFSSKPEKMHYRILVDRVNGSALIYVNGQKRADWKLSKVKPEDLGKCGGAFSITPHASMSNVTFQLSNVRILPWDGKEPAQDAAPAPAKGDQTFTSDGGAKGGTIERITDTEIFLATPDGKTRREKTVFLRFAEPAAPKESPATVAMARLRNGSEISAAKVQGTGDVLIVTTRSGPEITLPFAALRSLDYLPRAGQAEVVLKNLDILTLNDGSQIAGRAILPFADSRMSWKIAGSKAPLEFASEKVAGIVFRGTESGRKITPLKGDSVLRLGNGDWLPGDVVSLDGTQLVMKTDLAARLTVPLSGLRAVYLNADAAATVADGATGPDLWSEGWNPNRSNGVRQIADASAKNERPWKYFDGGYTVMGIPRNSQQTISRQWPAYSGAYALNFESTTPGRSTYFNAQIFNSKDERTFSVQASGTRLYIYYNPGFSRLNRAGMAAPKQLQIDNKNESGKARVSLVFDRPAKTFRIIVGGKEVGKIAFKEDEAREALDARGMTLTSSYYSSVSGSHSRIERLWFAPWNGLPEKTPGGADKTADKAPERDNAPAPEAEAKAVPAPVIYLANGDDFSGMIDKITPDLVTVTSDAGPLEFPAKRIAWIHFPNCSEPIADHFPRLRFHDRGLLSVNDLRIGGDRVQCKTLAGQPLDFPLSVVKEVIWRPIADK